MTRAWVPLVLQVATPAALLVLQRKFKVNSFKSWNSPPEQGVCSRTWHRRTWLARVCRAISYFSNVVTYRCCSDTCGVIP